MNTPSHRGHLSLSLPTLGAAVLATAAAILLAVPTTSRAQITTLTSFNGAAPDGGNPLGGVMVVGTTLYGTTYDGGTYQGQPAAGGTVFSMPVGGGAHTILASFSGTNGGEGAQPEGDLTLSGGTFYGTTYYGGTNDDGTVFSVPVGGGTPTTLATFNGTNNGANPTAGLTLVGSTLYVPPIAAEPTATARCSRCRWVAARLRHSSPSTAPMERPPAAASR